MCMPLLCMLLLIMGLLLLLPLLRSTVQQHQAGCGPLDGHLSSRGVNPWSASFTIALMHAQHLFQSWLQMCTDSLLISTPMVVPMEPTAAYTEDEPQALTIRHVAEQASVIVAVVNT